MERMIVALVDIHFELTADLQHVLNEDFAVLQQQRETIKIEQLHDNLKAICDRMDKSPTVHRVSTLPFFTGPNAPIGKHNRADAVLPFRLLRLQIPSWSNL